MNIRDQQQENNNDDNYEEEKNKAQVLQIRLHVNQIPP